MVLDDSRVEQGGLVPATDPNIKKAAVRPMLHGPSNAMRRSMSDKGKSGSKDPELEDNGLSRR
ncbi:MAG TPA: hypothetical protein VGM96_08870, partial [Reyranella sp.]